MKKIWSFISNFLLTSGAKTLTEKGGDVLDKALDDFYAEDPIGCTALAKSIYAFVPFLQRLTAKTETPLDDNGVAEIKVEIEEFAAQYGITL